MWPLRKENSRIVAACERASGAISLSLEGIRPSSGSRRVRSEEHTSELQSLAYLVCRLLLEKKKNGTVMGEGRGCRSGRWGGGRAAPPRAGRGLVVVSRRAGGLAVGFGVVSLRAGARCVVDV